MAYVLNNIRFRSVSAKALERYFNAKAFILNELTDDVNYFPNVYYSKYYGLNSVIVDRYE